MIPCARCEKPIDEADAMRVGDELYCESCIVNSEDLFDAMVEEDNANVRQA